MSPAGREGGQKSRNRVPDSIAATTPKRSESDSTKNVWRVIEYQCAYIFLKGDVPISFDLVHGLIDQVRHPTAANVCTKNAPPP